MDASRLEVEFAHKYGAESALNKPWSKYTPGTSAHKRAQTATAANAVSIGNISGKGKKEKAGNKDEGLSNFSLETKFPSFYLHSYVRW